MRVLGIAPPRGPATEPGAEIAGGAEQALDRRRREQAAGAGKGRIAAGYDADLTSRSALLQSASALQSGFGFSPASVEWELFSQSREGAVITLRLPEDADFATFAELTELVSRA